MDAAQQDIFDRIAALNFSGDEAKARDGMKAFLRATVDKFWPAKELEWQLERPYISESLQASPACGVLPYFRENGVVKVLMFKAGTHYVRDGGYYQADPTKPTYLIPGGFMELDKCRGSTHVKADEKRGEHPREGAVRELEEELVDDQGQPILKIDPERLMPLDFRTISLPKNVRHLGMSNMVELTREEVTALKQHVARLAEDTEYRHAVRERTKNKDSGKPEACTATLLPLQELAKGKYELLYPDQASIFPIMSARLSTISTGRVA